MADSFGSFFSLLLQLIECTHRCRKIVAQLDAVLSRASHSTAHSVLVAEFSRVAKEMMSILNTYEAVCRAAVVLLHRPDIDGRADTKSN